MPSLKTSIFVLIIILLGAGANAVDLKPSPIRNQSDAYLFSGSMIGASSNTLAYAEDDEWLDNNDDVEDNRTGSGKKSVVKAALYSALIPGGGEYYNGNKKKAVVFFTAEVLTWVGYASFHTYANWKKDDMIRYAGEKAGASLEGKSREFEDWVGAYDDIDDFNMAGRVTDLDRAFLPDNETYHWYWETTNDRLTYKEMKNSYRENFRRADFMIGIAIVNRLISIIDSVRDARRAQRSFSSGFSGLETDSYKVELDPFNSRQQIRLTMYPGF